MRKLTLLALLLIATSAHAQNWSNYLDPSRAVPWNPGFSIPSWSTPCPTQPSFSTGSGNAAANTTSFLASLASCSADEVVNFPSGTYYLQGTGIINYSNIVVRGAGAASTYIYVTTPSGTDCRLSSGGANLCIDTSTSLYAGSGPTLPGGSNACSWTSGYSQGTTVITLNSCGSTPPAVGMVMMLDQANDSGADTGGVFVCDTYTTAVNCTLKNEDASNANGRVISGVDYSLQEAVQVTAVSGSGSGPYTVTISPGVYFNSIRSGQNPGAWYMTYVQQFGIEDMTLDWTNSTNNVGISFDACYHCWANGIRSINAARDHGQDISSVGDVWENSYFYQSQSHGAESYTISPLESSAGLIVNNIFQQVNNPVIFAQGSGYVIAYNFSVGNPGETYMQASYASHAAGNAMNLFEGNQFNAIFGDDTWGTSGLTTLYRNQLTGWQSGYTDQTLPILLNYGVRGYNVIGNVLGQPGYATQYQAYATSSTAVSGSGSYNTSIYGLGATDNAGLGNCTTPPVGCDTLVPSTLMRWGNYDVVNAANRFNTTEASPGSVAYINANFSSSYFSSLGTSLPSSFYLSSAPSWWPSSKAWPAIGPDVTTGNVGTCSGGTYAGAAATSSSQCTGGSLSTQWASHVVSIPAMDCYLTSMGLPPDGSGSVGTFNPSTCYSSTPGASAPVFSPSSGTVPQTPTITSATSGATICWAFNTAPTAPTAGTCGSGSNTLTNGGSITASSAGNYEALATKAGYTNSSITTATFTSGGSSAGPSVNQIRPILVY